MNQIALNELDKSAFTRAFEACKVWSAEHQAETGVAEMALGFSVIAWGIHTGDIRIGDHVVGTALSDGGILGAAVGSSAGAIGASVLGSIGIAGAYTFGLPVMALATGGMFILGAAGYGIGDVAEKFLGEPTSMIDVIAGASAIAVGIALIVDGARRVVKDERVLAAAAKFTDGIVELKPLAAKIVARTKEELDVALNEIKKNAEGSLAAAGTTIGGAVIGSSIAGGMVTVMGSHALGGVALSLGLVSAPIWPVIAGGAAGLALGVAAWKGIKYLKDKDSVIEGEASVVKDEPMLPFTPKNTNEKGA